MVDIYPATNRPGKCPPLAVDANYINPGGGGGSWMILVVLR